MANKTDNKRGIDKIPRFNRIRIKRDELRIYLFHNQSESGEYDKPVTAIDHMPTATAIICSDPVSAESQRFRALRRLYRELEDNSDQQKPNNKRSTW